MNHIIDNIFISDADAASDVILLGSNNIRLIFSVGCDISMAVSGLTRKYDFIFVSLIALSFSDKSIEVLSRPDILDNPEVVLFSVFETLADSYDKLGPRNILVHCVYGQSRSVACVVFLLLKKGLSLDESMTLVKNRRADIAINPGFLAQLFQISSHGIYSREYALAVFPLLESFPINDKDKIFCQDQSVCRCKKCRRVLFDQSHVYFSGKQEKKDRIWERSYEDFQKFYEKYIPSVWTGYNPPKDRIKARLGVNTTERNKLEKIVLDDIYLVVPLDWVIRSINETKSGKWKLFSYIKNIFKFCYFSFRRSSLPQLF